MNIVLVLASVALTYGWIGDRDSAAAATDVADAQAAAWTPKELSFTYQGFTTHYSCDGRARKCAARVSPWGHAERTSPCTSRAARVRMADPSRFRACAIKMQVLTPVAAAATPDAKTVAAHWKTVDLRLDRDPLSESGDCELLEQIKQSILPLFTTRNIKYSSTCVPHQLSAGGTKLQGRRVG